MQQKEKKQIEQVEYQGRWVNKEHFRVFVYAEDGSEKLAKNYEEYCELINSGLWFQTKDLLPTKSKSMEKRINTINQSTVEPIEEFRQVKNQFKSGRRSRNI